MSIAGLTEKQYLYEYDPRQGDGWWIKPVPVAEPWFQEELTRFSGLHDGRRPRLRLVWAGDLLHDITHEPQLKYKAVREITVGYFYKKLNGEIGTTKSMNLAKDAAWPWEFHPKTRRLELGRLRAVGFTVGYFESEIPRFQIPNCGIIICRKSPYLDLGRAWLHAGENHAPPLGPLLPFRLYTLYKFNLKSMGHYLREIKSKIASR